MRILNRLWLPAMLALSVSLALSTLSGERGLLHLWKLQQELGTLEANAVELLGQNRELRDRLGRLQNDPEFLEKVAREELGFARRGEVVYRFRETANTPAP